MQLGAVMSTRVVSVEPDETVRVAIARMTEEHVGSVAVCDGHRLVGIFTERDVLWLAASGTDFDEVRVGDVMTKRPVTATTDVRIVDAARFMDERKIRHLPIVEGENLIGMVGIRDVLRTLVESIWSDHDAGARETARDLLSRSSGSRSTH